MKLICRLAVILSFSLMVPGNRAAEDLPLDEHLAPLKPLLGKTWRGEFKNSTQYLKEGTWTDGHEVLYKEAPHALVVFK